MTKYPRKEKASYPKGFEKRLAVRFPNDTMLNRISWAPSGKVIACTSDNGFVYLVDPDTGNIIENICYKKEPIIGIAWSPDSTRLAFIYTDGQICEYNFATDLVKPFYDCPNSSCICYSPTESIILTAADNCIYCESTSGFNVFSTDPSAPHTDRINYLAWSPDKDFLATASSDHSIRIWHNGTWKLKCVLKGHYNEVFSLAWAPNSNAIASGSMDSTICIWDTAKGRHIVTLEGHTDVITSLSFSAEGKVLASKSADNTIRIWNIDTYEEIASFNTCTNILNFWSSLCFHPFAPVLTSAVNHDDELIIWDVDIEGLLSAESYSNHVQYLNAKVVMVGDSGVGKSSLGMRMSDDEFKPIESSHAANFWQIQMPEVALDAPSTMRKKTEITLWDFAGQPEYRLVHQLFLNDIDAALILFDSSESLNPFRGVFYWAKILRKNTSPNVPKFLVSSRCDVSPPTFNERSLKEIIERYCFHKHAITSSKTGFGVKELLHDVYSSIPWSSLTRTTTPYLFDLIREFIFNSKAEGRNFLSLTEIKLEVERNFKIRKVSFSEINTVLNLLQARGFIYKLEPRPKMITVLLNPDYINKYASSIIHAARNHQRGIGAVSERDVLLGNFDLSAFQRLPFNEEALIISSAVDLLIEKDVCFREMGLLVFPSQIKIDSPKPDKGKTITQVTYQFSGNLESIFASLVVRLRYTDYFVSEGHWRYAAEFSINNGLLGFSIKEVDEGTGEIEIYFAENVTIVDRVTFIQFIREHLHSKGVDIDERYRLFCPVCRKEFPDHKAIYARVNMGKFEITCQYCDKTTLIPKSLEDYYNNSKLNITKQTTLKQRVETRTKKEVKEFQANRKQYIRGNNDTVIMLHMSDIHMGFSNESEKWYTQIETDLVKIKCINRIDYLMISGDIGNFSTKDEYIFAFSLLDKIVKRFGLDSNRIMIAPGNHDINWDLSEESYKFMPKRKVEFPLKEGCHIAAGETGYLMRDEYMYRTRFNNFSKFFYSKVYNGAEYPEEYSDQGIIQFRSDDKILFITLNSAWNIDHNFTKRSSINMNALSKSICAINDPKYEGWVKCAIWHHPISGKDCISNPECLQLLSVNKIQILFHGHIHESISDIYRYDSKYGIHIIGAGTFGAPAGQQLPGIPLQYNILRLNKKKRVLTVESRKKEKADGAWSADSRWGDKEKPSSIFRINL